MTRLSREELYKRAQATTTITPEEMDMLAVQVERWAKNRPLPQLVAEVTRLRRVALASSKAADTLAVTFAQRQQEEGQP